MCDSRWKVPTIGHLGGLEPDLSRDFPRYARRLELSVCYHTRTTHFRTPSFSSSYCHRVLTDSEPSYAAAAPPLAEMTAAINLFPQALLAPTSLELPVPYNPPLALGFRVGIFCKATQAIVTPSLKLPMTFKLTMTVSLIGPYF